MSSAVDAEEGNFHLHDGSPAIDKGADLSEQGVRTDFEGDHRPQGAAFDIGADEFKAARKAERAEILEKGSD